MVENGRSDLSGTTGRTHPGVSGRPQTRPRCGLDLRCVRSFGRFGWLWGPPLGACFGPNTRVGSPPGRLGEV